MGLDKRGAEREDCLIEATVKLDGQPLPLDCVIENISETGAKVRLAREQKLPPQFVLMVPMVPDHHEAKPVELRWQVGSAAGVKFHPARKPTP